ncbi:IclR family transcriptional regulator [Paralcaligenes ureilyticus]|uniref:IclR family transcriptional regulator n=1 Tax=Paralcaligenes ureilyticus TaxID=627131 RepID=A0A4R3MCA1_9BURK|nr:IclR family transcriptional regulator [Paralcaligenes ureilyticus]TCT09617.1 IclR family transcriptional regulator [Paralcaligenes ureilyticus]
MTENQVAGTQSIRRASTILQNVAAAGQHGVRLSELAQHTQLERATVHRMLKALLLERWLDHDEVTKRYVLGPLIFELGLCIPARSDFRSIFQPALRQLVSESQETVYLNVRSGLDFVCMAREDSTAQSRAMLHDVGGRRPLGIGASGIALLMGMDLKEAELIVKKNSHRFHHYGLTTYELALESVRQSSQLRYALSRDLDVVGLSAIGLPLHNAAGQVFSAISVVIHTPRLTDKRCSELVMMMRSAVDRIERKIIMGNAIIS